MKKRMICLLLGITMIASSAMPAYATTSNRVQKFITQSEMNTVDVNLPGFVPQVNVTKTEVVLDSEVKVVTLDILENEMNDAAGNADVLDGSVVSELMENTVNTNEVTIAEALNLTQSISNVIAESQEEVQRLIEEERKEEEERKRKEEEERKRKEEEERKRKEEEERKRKEEERKRKEEEERKRKEEARKQQAAKKASTGAKIVSYAKRFVGNPYVYGGNSLTKGIDCSHFVYQVLKNCGVYNGGYITSAAWRTKGTKVSSLSKAQAGDIICYDGHVAIYDGNGMIVEALGKKHGICYKRRATSDKILAIRRFV